MNRIFLVLFTMRLFFFIHRSVVLAIRDLLDLSFYRQQSRVGFALVTVFLILWGSLCYKKLLSGLMEYLFTERTVRYCSFWWHCENGFGCRAGGNVPRWLVVIDSKLELLSACNPLSRWDRWAMAGRWIL